jgi:hypothetical protein
MILVCKVTDDHFGQLRPALCEKNSEFKRHRIDEKKFFDLYGHTISA